MKREIALYLVFGLLTTAIAIGTYGVFLHLGLHYFLATSLSWLLAVSFAFVTNRGMVFKSKTKGRKAVLSEALAFFSSRVGTWFIETLGLIVLIDILIVDQMVSKYLMSILVIILNYILSKVFVFKNPKNESETG